MARRTPPRPTRRLALAVAVLGGLVIALGAGAVLAAVGMLVLAAAFLADAVALSRVEAGAGREMPRTVALEVPASYSLVASAPGGRLQRVRQGTPPEVELEADAARGGELRTMLRGRFRGEHPVPAATGRISGPLGLASRNVDLAGPSAVRVVPDLPKARRLARARRRAGGLEEGLARRALGVGTEFETIRDYSPDDDIKQVNWIASARVGRTMTNQYRVDENRDVICLLDAGRLMASPIGELTRLDVALDALATLAVEAESGGDRVGVLAFSSDVLIELRPRRQAAAAVLDALHAVQPSEVESDYERAFAAVSRHKRALIVIFTDLVDETAARSLLEATSVLARRHAVMVATCADPDLAEALARRPATTRDVLRATVAVEMVGAAARVVAQLRALGVTVVEAAPERLGPAAVRAYLVLKSRARL
jgi:uncharacterized protein (DUF58 family)